MCAKEVKKFLDISLLKTLCQYVNQRLKSYAVYQKGEKVPFNSVIDVLLKLKEFITHRKFLQNTKNGALYIFNLIFHLQKAKHQNDSLILSRKGKDADDEIDNISNVFLRLDCSNSLKNVVDHVK